MTSTVDTGVLRDRAALIRDDELSRGVRWLTGPTWGMLSAAADEIDRLHAAADQIEAVRGLLQTLDPGNPYMYDPWSDESVDPTNIDEVVRAAVSAGWSKGAHELARSIREAVEDGTSHD